MSLKIIILLYTLSLTNYGQSPETLLNFFSPIYRQFELAESKRSADKCILILYRRLRRPNPSEVKISPSPI